MESSTKILLFSVDEAEERVRDALGIMDKLDVDPLHWEAVFANVMALLGQAHLHIEQPRALGIIPNNLRG
jgi:hypothetical protein